MTDPDELLEPDSKAGDGHLFDSSDSNAAEAALHDSQQSPPEAPSPADPNADLPDAVANYEDVDPAVRTLFWKLVVLYKIGLLATSLGGILFAFRGSTLGLRVCVLGAAVFAYALYRTHRAKRRLDDGAFDDGSTDAESTDEAGDANPEPIDSTELEDTR